MKYADAVVRAVRLTVRNPFAVLLVSVGVSVSLLPLLTGVVVGGAVGGIVGLWTTSLLLGFVGVGGARISVVVVEREVSLGTRYFWDGIRSGKKMGPAVGLGTFVFGLIALVLASNPLDGVVGLSIALVGVYLLIAWFVLAMFALTLWASFECERGVKASFTDGGRLILSRPVSAVWLVVQAIGWSLLSLLLIIAPVFVLPGFVQLIGTALVSQAANEESV